MSNALRTRTARVLLATIVFVSSAGLSALVVSNLDAISKLDAISSFVGSNEPGPTGLQCCFCYDLPPPSCVDRADDDHCFRELYRAQLEALDANRYFDRLSALNRIGASFARPTVVRQPLFETTY